MRKTIKGKLTLNVICIVAVSIILTTAGIVILAGRNLIQKQTEALQDASERFVKAEPKITPEQEEYLMKSLGIAPALDDVWKNMEQASRAVEVSNSYTRSANVSIGDVHVHVDGSSVVDPDSFCDAFRRSNKMQRVIQAATLEQIASPYPNTLAVWNN